jgi:adenylylsulfate kinase
MVAHNVFLNGTVGVGKTTTAAALGNLLTEHHIPHAVVDLDETRRMWPSPAGDRFHARLSMQNLAALAANYRSAGAQRLVLAGVVESRDHVTAVERAIGDSISVVRLVAAGDVTDARLQQRDVYDVDGLAWSLERRGELHGILEAADIDDHVVVSDGRQPAALAEEIFARLGW